MIDFMKQRDDGATIKKPISIIGVGGAGAAIIDQIKLNNLYLKNLTIFDTDESAINGSICENKHLLGSNRVFGSGCNKDMGMAEKIANDHYEVISDSIEANSINILITGIGGGTGSGFTHILCDIIRQKGAQVITIAISPFTFEGRHVNDNARRSISVIKEKSDVVLAFSNSTSTDIVTESGSSREGMTEINRNIAKTVESMIGVLSSDAITRLDIHDFQSLMGDCEGLRNEMENCWVATGEGTGEDKIKEAYDEISEGLMLKNGRAWSQADKVLISVEGGQDMSVAEFNETVKYISDLIPFQGSIIPAATINFHRSNFVKITLFVARSGENMVITSDFVESTSEDGQAIGEDYQESNLLKADKDEVVFVKPHMNESDDKLEESEADNKSYTKKKSRKVTQEELPLENKVLLGRFENARPTYYNGQNLDTPTFLRLKVPIKV